MTRWMIVFCVMHFFYHSLAQSTAVINDSIDHRDFMPSDLLYFVDASNSISFSTISSPEFSSNFQRNRSYQNTDFKRNASYWINLSFISKHTEKFWILEFYDQTIDSIIAYVPYHGKHKKIVLGDHQRFTSRLFPHKNFEIPLYLQNNELSTYYFKVKSHEFADMRIALRSTNYFTYYSLNEYYLYGMFYGMILIVALYNFMVYLAIREMKFIYYIFYILSVAFYAMSYDGIGFQYLWKNSPRFNDWAVGVSLYLVILWALVFTRRFLSTRAHAPQLDKVLRGIIIIRSVWFIISITLFPQLLSFRTLEIIPLSLIFLTAINVWVGGYSPARFFVIAYGILFLGFFIRILVYFNLIPFTIVTHYSLHFSFVFEMLFLTVALGDRIRILKDNRDRALKRIITQQRNNISLKDKVNRELEQKVGERTLEVDLKNLQLEESNKKLEKQAEEINQINSLLDLDNWKLKNRVKQVLEERMHESQMGYAEFTTLYPDELTCYRFLDELKQARGFECQKCGGSKFSKGSQKFSRRCTKCGYNESITANTIFHSLKFPITKAFYLAYLSVNGKNTGTLESISENISLRLNTVWAFRQKIEERLDTFNQRKLTISSWEDIIFNLPKNKSVSNKSLSVSN
ncbi:MAG: receptor [Bacteroidetes bacterium]|nr:receptor [Bacteroidota bacterium]MBS1539152.1 receptor [Bacteroidota bacterium]